MFDELMNIVIEEEKKTKKDCRNDKPNGVSIQKYIIQGIHTRENIS